MLLLRGGVVNTERGAPATRFGSRCAGLLRVAFSMRFWALGRGAASVTVAAWSEGGLPASPAAGSDAGLSSAGIVSVAPTGVAASLDCEASGAGDAASGAGDAAAGTGGAAAGTGDTDSGAGASAVVACNAGVEAGGSVRVARYIAPAMSAAKHTVANARPGNKRLRAGGGVTGGSTATVIASGTSGMTAGVRSVNGALHLWHTAAERSLTASHSQHCVRSSLAPHALQKCAPPVLRWSQKSQITDSRIRSVTCPVVGMCCNGLENRPRRPVHCMVVRHLVSERERAPPIRRARICA